MTSPNCSSPEEPGTAPDVSTVKSGPLSMYYSIVLLMFSPVCRDPFSRFRHIMTLLNDTERELDSLRYELVVHNSSSGSSSAVRDMERRLKRLEWKVQLFTQMKANYESAGWSGGRGGWGYGSPPSSGV